MYLFDDTRRPLIVAHLSGRISPEEFARFQADIAALIDTLEPFALVYDIARAEIPDRATVMEVLRWVRDLRAHFKATYEDRPDPIPTFTAYHMPGRLGALLHFMEQMSPSVRSQQLTTHNLEDALLACEKALFRFGFDAPAAHADKRAG